MCSDDGLGQRRKAALAHEFLRMSDEELRTLEHHNDVHRARALRFRAGLLTPQDAQEGDVVEIGPRIAYNGHVSTTTWAGQPCPVRVLIVGRKAWRLGPGNSWLVRAFPPLRVEMTHASPLRVLRIVEVNHETHSTDN